MTSGSPETVSPVSTSPESIPVRTVSAPAGEGVAQLDRRPDGTQSIVLVGGRHTEDGHDATVPQPLDRRAVALEHRRQLGKRAVTEPPAQLRVEAGRAHGLGDAGHENRDRLANRRRRSGGLRAHRWSFGGPRGDRRLRQVELGILAQDGLVQLAQLAARLDAELLDQVAARCLVDLERVGVAAGAVEREHELGVGALAQRLLPGQRLELAHELGMAAEREVGVDPRLQAGQAELLQAGDLGLGEGLVAEVRKGRATPERQRPAQRVRRFAARPALEQPPRLVEELLEQVAVALARERRAAGTRPAGSAGGRRRRAPCAGATPSPAARSRRTQLPPQSSSTSRSAATASFACTSR